MSQNPLGFLSIYQIRLGAKWIGKVKVEQSVCIAPSMVYKITNHFKALRHGSYSLTCKEQHACLYLASVHQMAPLPIEVANI